MYQDLQAVLIDFTLGWVLDVQVTRLFIILVIHGIMSGLRLRGD